MCLGVDGGKDDLEKEGAGRGNVRMKGDTLKGWLIIDES